VKGNLGFSWLSRKSNFPFAPSNQGFLGPCPDDRVQEPVPIAVNESAVRPNPTLFVSKILSNFVNLEPTSTAPPPTKNKSNFILDGTQGIEK
jgi:hypothetical protein